MPVVSKGPFRYKLVNVADQQRDHESLLNWIARLIRSRADRPEFGLGGWEAMGTRDPSVLALRYRYCDDATIVLHNLSAEPRRASVRLPRDERRSLMEVFANRRYEEERSSTFELDPYGYRWLARQR